LTAPPVRGSARPSPHGQVANAAPPRRAIRRADPRASLLSALVPLWCDTRRIPSSGPGLTLEARLGLTDVQALWSTDEHLDLCGPASRRSFLLRASVRRHRRAQGDCSTLRSIRPKRARLAPPGGRTAVSCDGRGSGTDRRCLAVTGRQTGPQSDGLLRDSGARRTKHPDATRVISMAIIPCRQFL
jgi:hypothetical protein